MTRTRRFGSTLAVVALALTASCGQSNDRAGNRAPVAVAGADAEIVTGGIVQLDGTTSNDSDGDPITFQWTMIAKPEGSQAALSEATAPRPTFAADVEGIYEIELVVSDGLASSAVDAVVITATRANARPQARAGADRTVELGSVVTLDATESGDPDGDQLAVAWSITSKPGNSQAGLQNPSAALTAFVADVIGEFRISLVVDDGRVASEADEVVITAVDTNVPPTAAAGADQSVAVGTVVTIDGNASFDPDGDSLIYQWSIVSKPAGSVAGIQDSSASSSLFVADAEGEFVIQLIVNDGRDPSAPDVMVVTASKANSPPVARAGADQSVKVGDTVLVDGGGSSDADGDPLGFRWTLVSRPSASTAELVEPTSPDSGFVADVAGQYVIRLVVSDGVAESAPDTLTVTVGDDGGGGGGSQGCDDPGSTLLCDSLDGSTSGNRDGGEFVNGGWTPGWDIVWDLGATLVEGAFSAELSNWDTYHSSAQHHYEKQPVLNMYQESHGDNHTADRNGTSLWSIWTGAVFNDLFKFWSTTRGFDESIETRHSPANGRLDPQVPHVVRVEFQRSGDATVFLDGRTVVNHSHPRSFQLRYVFIGSDNSGGNYGPQSGVIYKNIKVWGSTSGGRLIAMNLSTVDGRPSLEVVPQPKVGLGLLEWLRHLGAPAAGMARVGQG